MSATIGTTEDQTLLTLGNWIENVLGPEVEVTQSQLNRVPTPAGAFVTMTPLTRSRLSTNTIRYQDDAKFQKKFVKSHREYIVQIDVYGENASDQSEMIATLFADDSASEWFKESGDPSKPLFADDPRQAVFMNEAAQYENRWTLDLHLQVNFEVGVPQQFAAELQVNLVEADTDKELNK